MTTRETRQTFCGLCHPRCGLLLHFENGKAVRVEGDPDHPISRGSICARGKLMVDHLYHPQRLNYPLKRVGERGSGQWQRVSWDQALDEVAEQLDRLRTQFGPETLMFTHGTHRTYHWPGRRFFNLFGSPNMCGANNICMCPTLAVEYATYGGFAGSDVRNSQCVVVWGRGASQSDPILGYQALLAAKHNGAKIIVVDPRRIAEVKQADQWLQIRPGTDVALMLGWIRVIIEEKLFDRDFVKQWTVGFDQLRRAVAAYPPDLVAKITWLTPQQVTDSARLYATTRPAAFPWGFGIDKQGINATQAARARSILRAITGNLDVAGGERLGWPEPLGRIIGDDLLEMNGALSAKQRAKQLGAAQYPFFGFPGWERNVKANSRLPYQYMHPPQADMTSMAHIRAVFGAVLTGKPYPVTAAISLANNPILALPNSRRVYQALKSLQLYVVSDYYLTPSAALADYVFPAASTVERSELWLVPGFCVACPQGLEPLYERRDDYQFWRGLAVRLGQQDHWPWETVEQVFDHRLAPVGLTFQTLIKSRGLFGRAEPKRYRQFGFGTPSGKVELRSRIFKALGCEPLPVYREAYPDLVADPEMAVQYPLVLITGSRFMPMYHTEQRQIPPARQSVPDPLVTLHPATAAKLGLGEGDWARITTPQGSIRQRVHLSDSIHPRMVDSQHGWWFPEREESDPTLFGVFESNANVLCPDSAATCSPEIGSWPHTALICRVEPE
ncbi:molybdopterin-dependent oxidoreductase [candidate division CSSED10-310 bacterium]|uniref:Molybdopterin-dependent oxidoreductase n=1 Tax=candidate division CSSED10-310 bacterium TaxID=2855610 RepID=A0ABV6YS76_UNCC1